jgi:hypothetical protein
MGVVIIKLTATTFATNEIVAKWHIKILKGHTMVIWER